jgi:uncharacterized protein (TIGR01777 family)
MKILISGSSGLIGSHLVPALKKEGYQVIKLIRASSGLVSGEVAWDIHRGILYDHDLEGIDAVIHLAGENLLGRWTEEKKRKILDSRITGTHFLCQQFAQLKKPPKIWLNASAIGCYGDRGDEFLTEESSMGEGFLAEVCKKWERATYPLLNKEISVAYLRFGIVLSKKGGMLKQILPLFKMGFGGIIGLGHQYLSWILLDDLIQAILYLIKNPVRGPVNMVSPNPVTNEFFTSILGEVLNRPTAIRIPSFLIRLLYGEMGKELLLGSQRVLPKRLQELGFAFDYPNLEEGLRSLLIH